MINIENSFKECEGEDLLGREYAIYLILLSKFESEIVQFLLCFVFDNWQVNFFDFVALKLVLGL